MSKVMKPTRQWRRVSNTLQHEHGVLPLHAEIIVGVIDEEWRRAVWQTRCGRLFGSRHLSRAEWAQVMDKVYDRLAALYTPKEG